MILHEIRFQRDANLSALTKTEKSKTMKAMVLIRRRRLHNVRTIEPSLATRLVLHYRNAGLRMADGGLGLRRSATLVPASGKRQE